MESSTSTDNYEYKIRKVLEKLLEPNFKIRNDVYLNSLYTHLTGGTENQCYVPTDDKYTQIFVDWIVKATEQWVGAALSPDIFSFALNLLSFISSKEITFFKLHSEKIYESIINAAEVHQSFTLPAVKVAYINLLSSLLKHNSGKKWLICTDYWRQVLNLVLCSQTHFISKEGCKFICTLLKTTVEDDKDFCLEAIETILRPLINYKCLANSDMQQTNNVQINDQIIYQTLCSSIVLLTEILEMLLGTVSPSSPNSKMLLEIFSVKYALEQVINNILVVAQNEDFFYDLSRVLCILTIFDTFVKFEGLKSVSYDQAYAQSKKLFLVLTDNINKGFVVNVLKLCYMSQIYWKNISKFMPVCIKKENDILLFENQLMFMQLAPVFQVQKIINTQADRDPDIEEVRDMFITKTFKIAGGFTVEAVHLWNKKLSDNKTQFENSTLALMYITKSKSFFSRESGTVVFQSLIHCLNDIVSVLKDKPANSNVILRESYCIEVLLDTIATYIEEFNIHWTDSLETACVMYIAFKCISIPSWPSKVVVKALKLVDISIRKYMTPNMALLVDRTNDSTLALVGPLLYAKLHDAAWEVRDSALEVICTIAYNAHNRFPSFQYIILESEILPLVIRMASCDEQSYVRASAFKCLQEIVQLKSFWDILISRVDNIHENFLNVLQNETEGIVRQEAAKLIAKIYEHQNFPDDLMEKVYDVLSYAATSDLHWEVKINALCFWEEVINNHLQNQGMIDGAFPTVTFSKEHKKIVTLNETEVQRRLNKVLYQLSEIGCLFVLVNSVQDDCDLEVSRVATKITKKLVDLLKKYNVDPPSTKSNKIKSLRKAGSSSHMPFSTVSQESSDSIQMTVDDADKILDEIINSQDSALLCTVYNPSDQMTINAIQCIKGKQTLPVEEFLRFSYTNLESHEQEKRKWLTNIDSFTSLLDDILKDYHKDDINAMDCY